YPCAQARGAVENFRSGDYLPLEVVVDEAIADLDLHRQDRNGRGVRVLARVSLAWPSVRLRGLSAHDHLICAQQWDGGIVRLAPARFSPLSLRRLSLRRPPCCRFRSEGDAA